MESDGYLCHFCYRFNWYAVIYAKNVNGKNVRQRARYAACKLEETQYCMGGFLFACALGNIYVAFSLAEETWVNFKVFGLTILTFVFTIASVVYIWNNRLPEEQTENEATENSEHELSDNMTKQASKPTSHDAHSKSE